MEREREIKIECVQNDRNVFMRDRDRECREIERVCVSEERHKRTSTGLGGG